MRDGAVDGEVRPVGEDDPDAVTDGDDVYGASTKVIDRSQ